MTKASPPKAAMLMAAGLGTRMRPLTLSMPKPLVPVLGKPLIDHVLDWLADSGVQHVVVNTHYMADMLEQHVRGRVAPHIAISYEPVLLETGGGLARALPLLGKGAFISANSDTLCIDGNMPALERLGAAWDDAAMDGLLLLHPRERAVGYFGKGDFFLNSDGSLRRRGQAVDAPFVFTGVQILHPRIFTALPGEIFSLNALYDRGMLPDGTLPRYYGVVHDGGWLHVGDPEGLAQAEAWLKKNAAKP